MNKDKLVFDNVMKESNKEKREFIDKLTKYLNTQSFFGKSLEEKTEFLITENGIKSIVAAAKKNLSLVEIANVFRISQREFINLKNSNPVIYDAFDYGYAQRDNSVIDSMYKLAQGFFVTEEDEHIMQMNGRETRKIIRRQKYIPPNVYAGQYIANNRKQFEYKRDTDKNQVPESNMFEIKLSFGSEGEDE